MDGQTRRAMLRDALTPVATSVAIMGTIGPVLPAPAAWAMLIVWPVAVVAACPPWGERWVPVLVWGARRASPAEQFTMATPVRHAQDLQTLHVRGLRVRVVGGGDVRGYGSRTVLLGEDVIAALRRRTLTGEQATARVGHQLGLLRSGATRWEPIVHVLSWPWQALASIRLPVLTPMLRAGWGLRGLYIPVLAYLAWVERNPFHVAAIGLLVLTFLVPRWGRSWSRARLRVADAAISRTWLAAPFARWLLQVDPSPAMYERVYALGMASTAAVRRDRAAHGAGCTTCKVAPRT
ncbi:hypothetical protein [uncultured Serinicoccus sp.]|uniref:hypothetical protein n=1 Tax=uncultured Serinicoccus sp. TaxID=735514 RepID=UPI002621B829|nr:hypothetical protein [uncultured Serinicoccus sp.]